MHVSCYYSHVIGTFTNLPVLLYPIVCYTFKWPQQILQSFPNDVAVGGTAPKSLAISRNRDS